MKNNRIHKKKKGKTRQTRSNRKRVTVRGSGNGGATIKAAADPEKMPKFVSV